MDFTNLKKFFIEISDIIYSERIFISGFMAFFFIFLISKFFINNSVEYNKSFNVIEAPKSDYYYKKSNPSEEFESSGKKNSQELFDFDPNTVSKVELQKLGFSEKVANIFLNYRSKGGKFYSKVDVQKIFGISPRLFQSIEPYIHIQSNQNNTIASKEKAVQIIDINEATLEDWESLPGIGKYYAAKFYNFRVNLGGFASIEQLSEIYGIQDSTILKIKPFITIKNPIIKKININDVSADELYKHPFLAKWQVEDIIKNRPIYGIDDLFDLKTFKDKSKNQRIIPYLSF